jgi:hypothetical protein
MQVVAPNHITQITCNGLSTVLNAAMKQPASSCCNSSGL